MRGPTEAILLKFHSLGLATKLHQIDAEIFDYVGMSFKQKMKSWTPRTRGKE